MEKNTRITMKQYTTPEQTAKLIELGFEKPKSIWALSRKCLSDNQLSYESSLGLTIRVEERFIPEYAYSIGELIEMLPQVIEFGEKWVSYPLRVMPTVGGGWAISYCKEYDERNNELIDALYDMIIKLKEEGVI